VVVTKNVCVTERFFDSLYKTLSTYQFRIYRYFGQGITLFVLTKIQSVVYVETRRSK
jgi:hypothetical protein